MGPTFTIKQHVYSSERRIYNGKNHIQYGSVQGLRPVRRRLPQEDPEDRHRRDQQEGIFSRRDDRSGKVHRLRLLRHHVP